MKPITKTIIFLVVAFIIVFIIVSATRDTSSPSTGTTGTTSASHESLNPSASPTGSVSPSTSPNASMTYTLADVAKHKTATDCWTAVSGSVYNLTPFVNQHPGGVENITKICGIDGTAQFMAQHSGERAPEQELATLKIGTLK